jgi:hypothetical protein
VARSFSFADRLQRHLRDLFEELGAIFKTLHASAVLMCKGCSKHELVLDQLVCSIILFHMQSPSPKHVQVTFTLCTRCQWDINKNQIRSQRHDDRQCADSAVLLLTLQSIYSYRWRLPQSKRMNTRSFSHRQNVRLALLFHRNFTMNVRRPKRVTMILIHFLDEHLASLHISTS